MKFKDLKEGYTLHVLDKSAMTYCMEKVSNVSMPHIDPKMSSQGMVVDVTTEHGTYCMVADADVAYPCNRVIATDRQHILREVEAMRVTSEQALSQVEHHKEMVAKCHQLIGDLDPSQKEKQAMEQRMVAMESGMQEIKQMLQRLARN